MNNVSVADLNMQELLDIMNTPDDGGPVVLTGLVCACGITHSNIFDGGPWMNTETGEEGYCTCTSNEVIEASYERELAQALAEQAAWDEWQNAKRRQNLLITESMPHIKTVVCDCNELFFDISSKPVPLLMDIICF